jgi:hypothetical protein
MRNEEFEIVRDLIAGRAPQSHARSASTGLAPAAFREIDGDILARQYVAHRKFLETEALARRFANPEDMHDLLRAQKLRGERRQTGSVAAGASPEARPGGWIASLARLLWPR